MGKDAESSAVYPVELDLDRRRGLRITWSDGRVSEFPVALLRRACPCATCRAAREEEARRPAGRLPVLGNPAAAVDAAVVSGAELVGAYALRLRWQDGHDTGIYDFDLLRALDPAITCDAEESA